MTQFCISESFLALLLTILPHVNAIITSSDNHVLQDHPETIWCNLMSPKATKASAYSEALSLQCRSIYAIMQVLNFLGHISSTLNKAT